MTENTNTRRKSQSQASITRARKAKKRRNNTIILVSIIAFFLGFYILEYVAALEKPPLGATFNIVLGCVIIAVSGMVLITTIKTQYFPKKRKRTKHVFLDETDYRKSREIETEG